MNNVTDITNINERQRCWVRLLTRRGGGGGLLPIMDYTVRLRQKGIPFVALGI